jgi:TetR/AcrR family transcriptional regulator, cholesterol catabolism regulator
MRDIATNIKKPELVAKRRQQIMKAAMELFLKNGFHGTTMRQICSASKVNRASIYDYFASKDDILVYIYKLVYIYRDVAYFDIGYDEEFPKINISKWKDLETFIRSVINTSWTRNTKTIQLLYRETIALDKDTKKQVMKIESNLIKWVAENLRKGLGLPTVTTELEILANTITFIDAFVPLRGWNMNHLDKEDLLNFVVNMMMRELKTIKKNHHAKK